MSVKNAVLNTWELFIEKIAETLALALTDQETEALVRSVRNFSEKVRELSSLNLKKLEIEAEKEKRRHCKHEGRFCFRLIERLLNSTYRCNSNCFRGGLRAFISAYAVKYLVGLVQALITGRLRQKPSLIFTLFDADTFRFASFFGVFIGGFKGLNCILRKLRDTDDHLNGFIAGCISGLALAIDSKDRRVAVAMYLSTRSLQMGYNALMKRRLVPNWKHGDTLLMALVNVQIIYAFMSYPKSLARSYYNWIYNLADLQSSWGPKARTAMSCLSSISNQNEPPKEIITPLLESSQTMLSHALSKSPAQAIFQNVFQYIWSTLSPAQAPLAFTDPLIANTHKYEWCAICHPKTTSCTYASMLYAFRCFPKTMKIYLPLNIAMILLWKSDKLLKDPKEYIKRIITSSIRSSTFITVFAAIAWLPPCYLRHLTGTETKLAYLLNGFLSGSTVILEQPKSRRLELALYCFPRALESLWNIMVDKGYVKALPYGEVVLFSLSMGLMMTLYQNEPDVVPSNYESVMVRFFGVN